MEIAAVQRAMARLYTDADLRREFYADAAATAAKLGVTPADAAMLAAVPPRRLEWFANALIGKRRNEVAKLMPATRCVVGERFDALFRRFASTSPPTGLHKHRSDTTTFARFLQTLSERGEIPKWAAEIARFEAEYIAAAARPREWGVGWFSYPVDELATRVPQPSGRMPRKRRTLILWFRWRRVARRLVIRLRGSRLLS